MIRDLPSFSHDRSGLVSELWCCQCFFYAPLRTIQTGTESAPLDSNAFRPLNKRKSLSSEFYHPVGGLVPAVLQSSYPATVLHPSICGTFITLATGVMTVIVNAINLHSAFRVPHAGKKIGEIAPSIADGNSASAIPVKSGAFGVVASGFDSSPDRVNAALFHSVRARPVNNFTPKASAGFVIPTGQRSRRQVPNLPAGAAAPPKPSSPLFVRRAFSRKTVEDFSGQVAKLRRNLDKLSRGEHNRFSIAHGDSWVDVSSGCSFVAGFRYAKEA